MRLEFGHDRQGGFIAGDADDFTAISYAYPTSSHAEKARRQPERVAREMALQAKRFPRPAPIAAELWARLRMSRKEST
jgi:hypothetical protein